MAVRLDLFLLISQVESSGVGFRVGVRTLNPAWTLQGNSFWVLHGFFGDGSHYLGPPKGHRGAAGRTCSTPGNSNY